MCNNLSCSRIFDVQSHPQNPLEVIFPPWSKAEFDVILSMCLLIPNVEGQI